MIRLAHENDVVMLAGMLRDLYKELQPAHYSKDLVVYIDQMYKHFESAVDTVYVEDNYGGFFIVRDETEPMAPTLNRYNGIAVYIRPESRHSSLLARFYKRLFEDFPNGEILGQTEINSEHIKVLDKRHTLIAKVYRLQRR